jgi:hypothetical protein
MHGLQRATKKHISTSLFETVHSSSANQTYPIFSTRNITYAQITKQNSYAPTNVEQEPHINQPYQQISDIQELKKYYEKPF